MENLLQSVFSINMLLGVHLSGAIVTGFFALFALGSVIFRLSSRYRFYAQSIAILSSFQLLTGSFLTFLSQKEQSLLTFCNRIGIYLLIVAFIESVLFYEMKRNTQETVFPVRSLGISLAIVMPVVLLAALSTIF